MMKDEDVLNEGYRNVFIHKGRQKRSSSGSSSSSQLLDGERHSNSTLAVYIFICDDKKAIKTKF